MGKATIQTNPVATAGITMLRMNREAMISLTGACQNSE